MSRYCPQCCAVQPIVNDSAGGFIYCEVCGVVLEEGAIVSEVTFHEGADGSHSAVGQFLPQSGSMSGILRGTAGYSAQSREITISRAKHRIGFLADQLKIGSRLQDAALRVYQLALDKKFTRGRNAKVVACACLYVVCRREKTPHMLLDFSELLQMDVFLIGTTFLALITVLQLKLPLVEPWLYVRRFAAQLEFGDDYNRVVNTSLKLIASMKRDWMQTGRRPAGLCGAALLVAARIHGYKRSEEEIYKTVRISGATLNRRLRELEETPIADMTPQEFEEKADDLTTECDPPAFKKSKSLRSIDRAFKMGMNAFAKKTGGKPKKSKKGKEPAASTTTVPEEVGGLPQGLLDVEEPTQEGPGVDEAPSGAGEPSASAATQPAESSTQKEKNDSATEQVEPSEEEKTNEAISKLVKMVESGDTEKLQAAFEESEMEQEKEVKKKQFLKDVKKLTGDEEELAAIPSEPAEEVVGDLDQVVEEERPKTPEYVEYAQDFSDIDDDELEEYFVRDEDELKIREELWDQDYKQFLIDREEKKRQKEEAAAERAREGRTRKKRKRTEKEKPAEAKSASEAAARELRRKSSRAVDKVGLDVNSVLSIDEILIGHTEEEEVQPSFDSSTNIFDALAARGPQKKQTKKKEEDENEWDDEPSHKRGRYDDFIPSMEFFA